VGRGGEVGVVEGLGTVTRVTDVGDDVGVVGDGGVGVMIIVGGVGLVVGCGVLVVVGVEVGVEVCVEVGVEVDEVVDEVLE